MSHLILGFPNQVDATFYTVAFSGGSWEATLPLTNLRDPVLARVTRSTDAALVSTTFDVDLGISRPIRLLCIPRSNLSRDARIRVRGSATAGDFSSPVYDTGWVDVWAVIYPWGSLNWEHPSFWTGQLSGEDAQDYDIAFIHVAAESAEARYWRWEIDDTENEDGYVELARLFMAPGWQPSRNFSSGAQIVPLTETTYETAHGGVRYYDRTRTLRALRFQIRYLDQGEALSQGFEMQRRLGIDRQLFVVMDPDDVENLHRLSFLGTFEALSALDFTMRDYMTLPFQIREVP